MTMDDCACEARPPPRAVQSCCAIYECIIGSKGSVSVECTLRVRHGNKRQWWCRSLDDWGRLEAIPPEPPSLARPFWRATVAERGMAAHPPGEPEPALLASWVVCSGSSMLGWCCRTALQSEASLQACLELDRRSITQCRVEPQAIVDALDEDADHLAGVMKITIVSAVDLLVFEGLHEALRLGVVVRIADAAHA